MSRPRRAGWLTVGLGCCLAVVCTAAPAGASGDRAKTLLERGQSYYRGKVLTLVSQGAVGSNFDTLGRILAPSIGSLLHATVVVENLSAGAGVQAWNTIAFAKPDGLTFGWMTANSVVPDIMEGLPGVGFNPAKLAFLGGVPTSANFYCALKSSGIASFAQLVKYPKTAHQLRWITSAGGSPTLTAHLVTDIFGLNASVLDAYSGTAAAGAGFLRGDGELFVGQPSLVGPWVANGLCSLIAVDAPLQKTSPYYAMSKRAPTLSSLFPRYAQRTSRARAAETALLKWQALSAFMLVAASAIPAPIVTALQWAVEKTFTNRGVESAESNVGQATGYLSPRSLKAKYEAGARTFGVSLVLGGLCPATGCPRRAPL